MFSIKRALIAAVAGVALLGQAHAGGMKKDIVDTAVNAGSFTTLVAAVQAAGLVDTLKGDGPLRHASGDGRPSLRDRRTHGR